jgi:hypothetical protein
MVQYQVNKIPPLACIWSQTNPFHNVMPYFFNIHFYVILSSVPSFQLEIMYPLLSKSLTKHTYSSLFTISYIIIVFYMFWP